MTHPLSARQLRTLEVLQRFASEERRMPSVRELAVALDLSAATTYQHLRALVRKGYLETDGTAHGMRIQRTADEAPPVGGERQGLVRVPLVGTIAAGAPIEAIEAPDEPLFLPPWFAPEGAYALRVKGESMVDDHILDGDLVVVKPQDRVERGEIAVALLEDGTATLKRVYPEKGRVRLQPANATMGPIYVRRLRIQGKVVGVIRRHA